MAVTVVKIQPAEHGFEWVLLIDDEEQDRGTAPAEHICLLDARLKLKALP